MSSPFWFSNWLIVSINYCTVYSYIVNPQLNNSIVQVSCFWVMNVDVFWHVCSFLLLSAEMISPTPHHCLKPPTTPIRPVWVVVVEATSSLPPWMMILQVASHWSQPSQEQMVSSHLRLLFSLLRERWGIDWTRGLCCLVVVVLIN